jgi:hypothetical protein
VPNADARSAATEHDAMTNDASTPNTAGVGMDASDMLDTLVITKREPRAVGGTWVMGTIAGHGFEALVFPEHASDPGFELNNSRISKLSIRETISRNTVANFDRGWDQEPATDAARAIVGLFCDSLAEFVFGR